MTQFITADKFDLSSVRVALEHATFTDFRVRDSLNATIKAIELDLDEVGFEPSENTREAIEALENTISDVETTRVLKGKRILVDDEAEEVIEEVGHREEDVDELIEESPLTTKHKPHEIIVEPVPLTTKWMPRDIDEEIAEFVRELPTKLKNLDEDDGN